MDPALQGLVGTLVSLSASAVDAIGLNLQRRDHVNNARLPLEEQRHECKRLTWHIGFFLYVSSQLFGSSAALYFLQPAVVASLGSAALVFNFFFAYLLVGTKITRMDILATFLIIIGSILVAVFGDIHKDELTTNQLYALYQRLGFILYFSLLEVITICIFVMTILLAREYHKLQYETGHVAPYHFIRQLSEPNLKRLLGFGYSVSGGLIASQTVVLAETTTRLVVQSVKGPNQFNTVLSFILLIVLAITAVLQVICMNQGLKICDPVLVVPVFFAFYSILALFNSTMYYNQWDHMLLLGIGITVAGVYFVSIGQKVRERQDLEEFIISSPNSQLSSSDLKSIPEDSNLPYGRIVHQEAPVSPAEKSLWSEADSQTNISSRDNLLPSDPVFKPKS